MAVLKDFSTTVGTTVKTVLNVQYSQGNADVDAGMLIIHNPNTTGNFMLSLSGGTPSFSPVSGLRLTAGSSILLDYAVTENPITAISDTANLPLTIYGEPS